MRNTFASTKYVNMLIIAHKGDDWRVRNDNDVWQEAYGMRLIHIMRNDNGNFNKKYGEESKGGSDNEWGEKKQ